ncbi:MAG: uroporphyrinogen-III C-methyltransferase [Bryobacter sp.]|nr:uroporphyrinogen-III C-methyltransferase [Bryobacter sp.]
MKVYLVGSGPGDPDLLTLKAKRLIESAEVILYDHLASQAALEFAPQAEKHYVGKRRDDHAFPQAEIGEMMIAYWRAGKRVVRLKGGDPFLFGRGGEECEALAAAGVPFEVVPGVSSAFAASAYGGIPLTHRDYSSSVAFVTGHHPASFDWHKVAQADTLAVFMGVYHYEELAEALRAAGRAGDSAAAAVTWATHGRQRTVVATLDTLGITMAEAGVGSPAILFFGEVANLAHRLNWFERLPLHGVRVVITRLRAQSEEMEAALRQLGAECIPYPVIEIVPPASYAALDEALAQLPAYDWIVFTSANGVEAFRERLALSPHDWRHVRAKLAAIGSVTKRAMESMAVKVDLCPEEYVAESLVLAMGGVALAGQRVLLPQAAVARDTIPAALRQRGAQVDVVEAYRNLPPRTPPAALPQGDDAPDWITFTSPSTVKNFLALAGADALRGVNIASIGPVTSEALRKHGFLPTVEADPHTTSGIVHAILAHPRTPRNNR